MSIILCCIYIVRAFGDPLFLKQTYGKGYHVNLVVNRENIEEAQRLVTQALPSSQLVINRTKRGYKRLTTPIPMAGKFCPCGECSKRVGSFKYYFGTSILNVMCTE